VISYLTLNLTADHPVAIQPAGGTSTVTVSAGSSAVYYGSDPGVSATNNQGAIAAGASASFTGQTWLRSAGLSSVVVATDSTAPTVVGAGDNVNFITGVSNAGVLADYRSGSASSPDTNPSSVVKVSRTMAVTSTPHGDGSEENVGIFSAVQAAAANTVQPVAIKGAARGSGPLCGVYGEARQTAVGSGGAAVGAFVVGYAFAPGTRAQGLQAQPTNSTGSDHTVTAGGAEGTIGVFVYASGANRCAVGVEVTNSIPSAHAFDVGFHVTSANGGAAVTAAFQDDSSAVASHVINGSHTLGIDFSAGTFSGAIFKTPAASEAATASAGAIASPGNFAGFLSFQDHTGTIRKIPYFAA
jgi:hypothetical protein